MSYASGLTGTDSRKEPVCYNNFVLFMGRPKLTTSCTVFTRMSLCLWEKSAGVCPFLVLCSNCRLTAMSIPTAGHRPNTPSHQPFLCTQVLLSLPVRAERCSPLVLVLPPVGGEPKTWCSTSASFPE